MHSIRRLAIGSILLVGVVMQTAPVWSDRSEPEDEDGVLHQPQLQILLEKLAVLEGKIDDILAPEPPDVAPDLVVLPRNGAVPCVRENEQLVVTIFNAGDGSVIPPPGIRVFVTYFDGEFQDPPFSMRFADVAGAFEPGESAETRFDIPPGCFSPDCGFRIDIDLADFVFEWDEENNTREGICVG